MYSLRQKIGLLLGPLSFVALLLIATPTGMSIEGQRVAAVASLMASEAIPIPVTALLPILLFPLLQVATPPNAIVFSSRQVTIQQMAKAGFWLNLIAIVLITLFVYFVLPRLWGIEMGIQANSSSLLR